MSYFHYNENSDINHTNIFVDPIIINEDPAIASTSAEVSLELREQVATHTMSAADISDYILPETIPIDVSPRKRITPLKQPSASEDVQGASEEDGMYI